MRSGWKVERWVMACFGCWMCFAVANADTKQKQEEPVSTLWEPKKAAKKRRPTKCGMRTVNAELCTMGGTGQSNGWYFDPKTKTCEDTSDFGSCSASGPFKSKSACEAAYRRGDCK